jgi:PilZ domain
MATYQGNVIETRSSERIPLQCSIIVANGVQTGEGRVLNVSGRGCLVEAPLLIKAGDHLQLRLFLPDTDLSLCVSLAVVHWAHAFRFGVEFIKMGEKHRAHLDHFIAVGKDPWKSAL